MLNFHLIHQRYSMDFSIVDFIYFLLTCIGDNSLGNVDYNNSSVFSNQITLTIEMSARSQYYEKWFSFTFRMLRWFCTILILFNTQGKQKSHCNFVIFVDYYYFLFICQNIHRLTSIISLNNVLDTQAKKKALRICMAYWSHRNSSVLK